MAGNKNSGRRGFGQEIAKVKEEIKKQTIEELAEDKLYNHLQTIDENDKRGNKEIVLPVYLKSKADKQEHSGSVEIKQVTGMEITKDEDTIQDKN